MSTSTEQPLLRISDLRVAFPTDDGLVHAVNGMDLTLNRGARPSASSASPAPARPSPARH